MLVDMESIADLEGVKDLVDGFDTGMLITRKLNGGIVAEPMPIAGWAEGALYLITTTEGTAKDRIACDSRVGVALQDARRCVSLSGTAEVVVVEEKLHALGSAVRWGRANAWRHGDFPLIRVQPTEMEIWETSPWKALNHARELIRAWLTGHSHVQQPALLTHARCDLPPPRS